MKNQHMHTNMFMLTRMQKTNQTQKKIVGEFLNNDTEFAHSLSHMQL